MFDLYKKSVHVINRMELPFGGSENRSIEIRNIISRKIKCDLWTEYTTGSGFDKSVRIRKIIPKIFRFPRAGIFIFVGTYYWVGNWLRFANPTKIIVIHNMPDHEMLKKFLIRLREIGVRCPIELVYAAKWILDEVGLPGRVFYSPINIDRFRPKPCVDNTRSFTVGRLSRDAIDKHHMDDIELYKSLVSLGVKVKIMGGNVLSQWLSNIEGIELIPSGGQSPEEFLQSIDVFYYRTSPSWFEPHGRVVTEAMSSGVPVVCGINGGYKEFILHGETGFLFENNSDAIKYILQLRDSRDLRVSVIESARTSIQNMFSEDAIAEQVEYFASPRIENDISVHLKNIETLF